jgi:uncharacterized protein YuzE
MAKIKFYFDQKGDILEISVGKPKKAISEELGDDIIAHKDIKTKKLIGFTILNFTKRFKKMKSEELTTPITASISLAR